MESRKVMDKDDKGNSVLYENKVTESVEKNSSSESLLLNDDPQHKIVVGKGKPPSSNVCDKRLFLQKISALESKIPRYVVSLDEKYLLRCLEQMHISAFKSTPCDSLGNTGIISTGFSSRGITLDMPRLGVECPFFDVQDRVSLKDMVATATIGDSILGTITASKSMMNILSSPLLYRLGALGSDANIGRRSFFDSKSPIASDVLTSPVKLVNSSPKKPENMVHRDDGYVSDRTPKIHTYSPSISSSSSDKSSSSTVSDAGSLGILKCTWSHGLPNYMFSVDDLGEVYVANVLKFQSRDAKSVDYVYNFHLKPGGKRGIEVHEIESSFVGKMEVSTSETLCPQNANIFETRFVLFGAGDNGAEEPETVHNPRKNKGLKKKVVNAIGTGHASSKITPSKYSATSIIHESMPPNLELAAVIVKNHVEGAPKKQEIGGWGLKFLKKPANKQIDELAETSASSESCHRDSGECSTSMNIVVPAGYHGGPRTRKGGGPSSIIERWSSGGHCDCGGWDIGCPLTLIRQENSPPLDDSGDCKAVDLYVQGSKQSSPIMKMTNVLEDVYYIHFHSTLSSLQCLSIAAAIIHNRTHALRP